MISLSDESKRLVSTFFAYRNDIDVYTEDEDKDKEFYRVLFKKLLQSGTVINDVTPLGPKSEVIKRCMLEPKNDRKKIFIVDGDVGCIHGENIPELDNLYVLDGYCIENFLFEKTSICSFIYYECATKSLDKIEEDLDFDTWLIAYAKDLINLFVHFSLVDYFGGRFTIFNSNKFHDKIAGKLVFSKTLVEHEIESLRLEILKLATEEQYETKLTEINSKWDPTVDNFLKIVSGKDYLIPILLIKSQEFKKSKALPSLEETKLRLLSNCGLSRLTGLKTAIESL